MRNSILAGSAFGLIVPLAICVSVVHAGDRLYNAKAVQVSLDGAPFGVVKSVAGGALSANVVADVGAGNIAKKHVTSPKVGELTIQLGVEAPSPLNDWVDAMLTGAAVSKTVTVRDCDARGKAVKQRAYTTALLTEVGFPAFDGQSSELGFLSLKIAPEQATFSTATGDCQGSAFAPKQKLWVSSNFRLELDGIDTSGVTRIDPFSAKLTVQSDVVGNAQQPSSPARKLELGDLSLSVAQAKSADFERWFSAAIGSGGARTERGKSGAIVLLGPEQQELARVTLGDVGIFGLKASSRGDQVPRINVSLYVGSMRFSVTGAQTQTTKAEASAPKLDVKKKL